MGEATKTMKIAKINLMILTAPTIRKLKRLVAVNRKPTTLYTKAKTEWLCVLVGVSAYSYGYSIYICIVVKIIWWIT